MYFLVLKQIHPKGTRTSSEGISTNYRSDGESLKADGKIPWAPNVAQAVAGAFDFATVIFIYKYYIFYGK